VHLQCRRRYKWKKCFRTMEKVLVLIKFLCQRRIPINCMVKFFFYIFLGKKVLQPTVTVQDQSSYLHYSALYLVSSNYNDDFASLS
jgi:hypothetical protein